MVNVGLFNSLVSIHTSPLLPKKVLGVQGINRESERMKSGNMNAIDVYDYFRRFPTRPKTFTCCISLLTKLKRGYLVEMHVASTAPYGTAGV